MTFTTGRGVNLIELGVAPARPAATDLPAIRCLQTFRRGAGFFLGEGGAAENRAREPASAVWRAMSNDARMPVAKGWAVTYEVSADQRMARLHLPPMQLAGVRKPVNIYMDMDAEAVDAFLRQLAEMRAQMLPALKPN